MTEWRKTLNGLVILSVLPNDPLIPGYFYDFEMEHHVFEIESQCIGAGF